MNMVILITTANPKEARKIAQALIKERLAACVNILKDIESLFWWEGKIDRCREVLLVVKSHKNKFSRIARLVKSLHSYAVPEIIALPIAAGEPNYLKWLNESIR